MVNNKKYNIGIIGAGMIAEKHITAFQQSGRANISWIARRNISKLGELKRKYNIPNVTCDYKDILNDPGVDAIIISTPPASVLSMIKRPDVSATMPG